MNNTLLKGAKLRVSSKLKEIKSKDISKFRLMTMAAILFKTIIFMSLLETRDASSLSLYKLNFQFWYVYLAFAGIFYSFGYLFAKVNQIKFYIIFNIAYTVMLIADLWYFRVNRDFWGLDNIFFPGTFNPFQGLLIQPRPIDLLFLVDLVFIGLWLKRRRLSSSAKKSITAFRKSMTWSLSVIAISFLLINIVGLSTWDRQLFFVGWSPIMSIRAPGPVGYHLHQGVRTVNKLFSSKSQEEIEEIKAWHDENKEDIEDNQYKGIFKGKNVIFLQLESFENFIINRKANGKEITPYLNKLAREGFYFNNIYEQNNGGNSSDADLMVNASSYTLSGVITATHYGEVVYPHSFQRILKSEGYTTVSAHADNAGEFNWTELHKNGFGVDILWDLREFKYEESVGYGLSDRSFLSQLAEKMKSLPEPYYLFAPTMSNHGPFAIDQKYRELDLPKEIDESYLGGYFECSLYTDRQIEMFLNKLDQEGMLDNTVVVLYGDHAGVHKYYNEEIQHLDFEGNWWKEYDHEIPLIIYAKGISPQLFETYGGHTDIMPTVAYMLGIDDSKYRDYVMGRILVNTKRDATVIKGNIIKGNVTSKEERRHLLKCYEIADKKIR